MLHGDSIEFDITEHYSNAEAVPIKSNIQLLDIWIPASLLSNRKRGIDYNLNKPGVFHVLQKPDISKQFSVYSDWLSDEEPGISCTMDNGPIICNFSEKDMREIRKEFKTSNTLFECGDEVIESSRTANNCNQHDGKSENEPGEVYRNEYSSPVENKSDEPCHLRNPMEIDFTTPAMPNEFTPRDSLEELYFSDSGENSCASESKCSLQEQNLCSEVEKSSLLDNESRWKSIMNLLNEEVMEEGECNTENIAEQGTEEVCNLPITSTQPELHENINEELLNSELGSVTKQSEEIDSFPTTFERSILQGNTNEEKQDEEQCNVLKTENEVEEIFHFPIAYKRPMLGENSTNSKLKVQKEKRNKKKQKKSVHLEDFLPNENEDNGYPEVDEFYENLMRKQGHMPYMQLHSAAEFPTLEKKDTITFVGSHNSNVTYYPQYEGIFDAVPFDNKTEEFRESISKGFPISNDKSGAVDEELTTEECHKNETNIIIIENIPKEVTKEDVENLVLGYGEMKRFTLKHSGKFLTAELELDCIGDVDWIVECLKGSQPFGTSTDEVLNCYKL